MSVRKKEPSGLCKSVLENGSSWDNEDYEEGLEEEEEYKESRRLDQKVILFKIRRTVAPFTLFAPFARNFFLSESINCLPNFE